MGKQIAKCLPNGESISLIGDKPDDDVSILIDSAAPDTGVKQ